MLDEAPQLAHHLEAPPPNIELSRETVNVTPYAQRLSDAAHWRSGAYIEDIAYDILQTAHVYREKRDYASALALYETVLQEVVDTSYDEINPYKEDPSLWDVFSEAGHGLEKLLTYGPFQSVDEFRQRALFALLNIILYDLEQGGRDLAYNPDCHELILQYARPEDVTKLKKALDHAKTSRSMGWATEFIEGFIADLELLEGASIVDIITKLIDEDMIIPALTRLLHNGEVERAEMLARDSSLMQHERFSVVTLFEGQGHKAEALRLAETWAKLGDPQIRQWLITHYERTKQPDKALDMRVAMLYTSRSASIYKQIKQEAQRLNRWDEIYEDIIATLRKEESTSALFDIYIIEGDWTAAWEIFGGMQDGWRRQQMEIEVAKKGGSARPEEAIDILKKHAENRIAEKNRNSYNSAANLLSHARPLYAQLGRSEEFTAYITSIRREYPRHRALQDELNKAGL